MRLLGPTSLSVTFQKTRLKEVLKNTCVYLSLYNCPVLTGALRTPQGHLSGLPWDFSSPLPMGPGPCFSSAWGHQSLLQRHCSQPAPALLDWSRSDSLGSSRPWLATLPSPDAHGTVDSACCHHHPALLVPPGGPGVQPGHEGIAQPAWWLLPAPLPSGSSPALAAL